MDILVNEDLVLDEREREREEKWRNSGREREETEKGIIFVV